MKKLLSITLALVCLLVPRFAHAESSKTYEVPVVLKHASAEKASMANKALSPVAEVKEEGGKMHYKVFVKPLSFMGQQGNLTNLFVTAGGREEAVKAAGKGEYTQSFSFVRSGKEKCSRRRPMGRCYGSNARWQTRCRGTKGALGFRLEQRQTRKHNRSEKDAESACRSQGEWE